MGGMEEDENWEEVNGGGWRRVEVVGGSRWREVVSPEPESSSSLRVSAREAAIAAAIWGEVVEEVEREVVEKLVEEVVERKVYYST